MATCTYGNDIILEEDLALVLFCHMKGKDLNQGSPNRNNLKT